MPTQNGRLRMMRRRNRAQVALGIQRHGSISRVQLAKMTGLSLACVCGITDELIAEGLVVEVGEAPRDRGRRVPLLSINPEGAPAAGVWLAPEEAQIAVASPAGGILARKVVARASDDDDPSSAVRAIAQGVRTCAESAGREPGKLRGVGVAVAGLVNPLVGTVDTMANRPGWDGVPIVRLLEDHLGVPVYLDIDIRAGAMAWHWLREKRYGASALYVLVCEGIGAAVVSGHQALSGAHDVAGTLGQMTMERNGPLCRCGVRGCLESVASDMAFIRHIWPEKSDAVLELSGSERVGLVRRGVQMALSGDGKANEALISVTQYLGLALANCVSLIDPHAIFVAGTMIDAAPDLVIDLIRQEAMQRIYRRARGLEIRAVANYEEFLLRGSIGLVLWQPYRILGRDITTAGAPESSGVKAPR